MFTITFTPFLTNVTLCYLGLRNGALLFGKFQVKSNSESLIKVK